MSDRKSVAMRFSPETLASLERLSENYHLSKTHVVEWAVRELIARLDSREEGHKNEPEKEETSFLDAITGLVTANDKIDFPDQWNDAKIGTMNYNIYYLMGQMVEVRQRLAAIEVREAQTSASSSEKNKPAHK